VHQVGDQAMHGQPIIKKSKNIVLKSGNLNLREPSRPVQTCNGIALPLPFNSDYLTYRHEIQTVKFMGNRIEA
jgi:hypothetical protein